MKTLEDKKLNSYSHMLKISKLDYKERIAYFDEAFSELSFYYGFLKSMELFLSLNNNVIKEIELSFNRLNIVSLKNYDERIPYTDEAIHLFMLIYGLIEGIFFITENKFLNNSQSNLNIKSS